MTGPREEDPTGLGDRFSSDATSSPARPENSNPGNSHSENAAPLDLSPRDLTPKSERRNWLPILACVGIAGAIIAVLLTTLGNAALFIYTADQAIAERPELSDSRFRLQGSPVGNTIDGTGTGAEGVRFTVNFEGNLVDVAHVGSPAELFQSGVPVVLEGSWNEGSLNLDAGANDGYHFASDNMIVSHDNDYRLENEERLDEARQGGSVTQ